jgi:hypothetical protein
VPALLISCSTPSRSVISFKSGHSTLRSQGHPWPSAGPGQCFHNFRKHRTFPVAHDEQRRMKRAGMRSRSIGHVQLHGQGHRSQVAKENRASIGWPERNLSSPLDRGARKASG